MVELQKGDRVISPHGEKGVIVNWYRNVHGEKFYVMETEKLILYSYIASDYTLDEGKQEHEQKESIYRWLTRSK